MSPDPYLSIHIYLRNFCKIHVSDSCLSILSIRFCAPCAGETQILTSGDAFCVALRRENSPAESRGSVARRRNANFDIRRRVLCGLAQGKQSDRVFRAGETQILNCRDEFFVALRRRNVNFDLRRRVFCPDHVDPWGVTTGWTKSPRRYSEAQKKFPSRNFVQAKRKFWPPELRFLWPCAVKNEGNRNLHLDLRGFTHRKNPSVCHTIWRIINLINLFKKNI